MGTAAATAERRGRGEHRARASTGGSPAWATSGRAGAGMREGVLTATSWAVERAGAAMVKGWWARNASAAGRGCRAVCTASGASAMRRCGVGEGSHARRRGVYGALAPRRVGTPASLQRSRREVSVVVTALGGRGSRGALVRTLSNPLLCAHTVCDPFTDCMGAN